MTAASGPLHVGFELTVSELDGGGTTRAAHSLLEALSRRDDVVMHPLAHPPSPGRIRGGRIGRGLARELSWLPVRLPRLVRGSGLDLLHCPGPVVPGRASVPVVVTVFDALPWRHPEWLTRSNVLSHKLFVRRAVRRAAAVITASEHSRGQIAEAYALETSAIRVVPLGVDSRFSPGEPSDGSLERLGVRQPYAFTVGTLQPRKNIDAVVRAFELGDPSSDLALVIAGGAGWGAEALRARVEKSAVRDRVVILGPVPDGDLVELYRGAECFVFPSRHEGFGLPVLEAMACGVPVVCSDRTSLPELSGDAALLVSPDEPEEFKGAIARLRGDPGLKGWLVDRGMRRAAHYTWDRCAEMTVAVYRSIVA